MTDYYTQNLLVETLKVLGDRVADVQWVGSPDFGWFSWDEFVAVADIDYDAGFGGQKVAPDLLVVGSDWWLERHEYDGSEWWELKTLPEKPAEHRIPKRVTGLWDKLKELHEEEDKEKPT